MESEGRPSESPGADPGAEPRPAAEVPIPLPPPLPPESEESIPAESGVELLGRLHPLTFVFVLWSTVRRFLAPAVLLFLLGSQPLLGFMLLAMMVGSLAFGMIRYFTFSYRIENGELITREGVVQRTERHIPLARVQDLRLEQGVLHRTLKTVVVHVETAGGQGAEATLSVLSRREADRLRRAVFGGRVEGPLDSEEDPSSAARRVVRELTVAELVKAGLTSNQAASVLVLLLALWGMVNDVVPKERYEAWISQATRWFEGWRAQGPDVFWMEALFAAAGMVGLGLLISAIGSVVLFYRFTLTQSGEDLRRAYGLLTRRSSSLPRRRIQLFKIEEGVLRRPFGLATLRVDTAGLRPSENEQKEGRDVLLPILPKSEMPKVLAAVFPDWKESDEDWRRVSRVAVRRGVFKGAAACLAAIVALWVNQKGWHALWPLISLPIIYAVNVMNYRRLGYSLGERYFQTRRGWLSRATHIIPIRNAQCVMVRQTPFDRRHGVATLMVDTAGQAYTGGSPLIGNVPEEEARALARTLAQRASKTRYGA